MAAIGVGRPRERVFLLLPAILWLSVSIALPSHCGMFFTPRRPARLPYHDYARSGYYFVTICSHAKRPVFSVIDGSITIVSGIGQIADRCWKDLPDHYPNVILDEMVLMPDHLHGILQLHCDTSAKRHGIPEIVRAFKGFSTRRINASRHEQGRAVWQRGYYERVIRDERELSGVRDYIRNNPLTYSLSQSDHGPI